MGTRLPSPEELGAGGLSSNFMAAVAGGATRPPEDPASGEAQVGRCRVLTEYCDGLMAKVLYLRDQLRSEVGHARPTCLQTADFNKMKKRLENSFPEAPDVARGPAFEALAAQASRDLGYVYELLDEVVECRHEALDAIAEISGCQGGVPLTLDLDHNPILTVHFMELVTSYSRLHVITSFFDEAKSILGLYFASIASTGGRLPASYSRVVSFILACDDPLKSVASELMAPKMEMLRLCVSSLLPQLLSSLAMASSPDRQRAVHALSPLDEQDSLPLPACEAVDPQRPAASLHLELCRASKYQEWVAYSVLVLPSAVFTSEIGIEVFKYAGQRLLGLRVYRGMTLNFHEAVESLTSWYPPKNHPHTLPLPKKTKLKDLTKEVAKDATRQCGLLAREKRAYIRTEATSLYRLFSARPGLLGPKLPVMLAVLSQAQTEIICFYRHLSEGGGPAKNRAKHYDSRHFEDPLISVLIGVSVNLSCLVHKYSGIVRRYYAEYLRGAHASGLRKLLSALPPSFAADIGANAAKLLQNLPGMLDTTSEDSNLCEFRFECERLLGCLARASQNHTTETLLRRISSAYEHSLYVDSLEKVMVDRAELTDAWWFRAAIRNDFNMCLRAQDSSSKYACAYLAVMGSAANNLTPYCPEEQLGLGSGCADMAEAMAEKIAQHVGSLAKQLIAHSAYYDSLAGAQAAVDRYERTQQIVKAKKKGAAAPEVVPEALPGSESQGWAVSNLSRVVGCERIIANLLSGMATVCDVAVYDRLIVPQEYVRDEIISVFRDHLTGSTVFQGAIERPSVALQRIRDGMRVLQRLVGITGQDVSSSLRKVLLEECTDWARIYSTGTLKDTKKRNVMDFITNWYLDLLEKISPGGSVPGVVFVESRGGFVASPNAPSNVIPADMFLDETEVEALCGLLGSAGARCVEQAVLEFVAKRVRDMHRRILESSKAIQSFVSGCKAKGWESRLQALADRGLLDATVSNTIAIGNALLLRRLLRRSLAKVYARSMPTLQEPVRSAIQSLRAIGPESEDVPGLEGFKSLAEDMGLGATCGKDGLQRDHSLAVALEGMTDHQHVVDVWDYFPHLLAASLAAECWKHPQYFSRLDAFLGGQHAMIPAMMELFGIFFGKQREGVLRALRTYSEIASFIVLHMKAQSSGLFREYHFPSILTFLDKFCEDTYYSRSDLGLKVPYALLHTSYLEMARTQGKSNTPGVV